MKRTLQKIWSYRLVKNNSQSATALHSHSLETDIWFCKLTGPLVIHILPQRLSLQLGIHISQNKRVVHVMQGMKQIIAGRVKFS